MLHWIAKRLNEAREDERGFTLIELLVVVIIIGVLMGIAVPIYLNQRASAQDAAAQANLQAAATAQSSYYAQKNTFTNDTSSLADYGYPTGGNPPVNIAAPSGQVPSTGNSFCMSADGRPGRSYVISDTRSTPTQVGGGINAC